MRTHELFMLTAGFCSSILSANALSFDYKCRIDRVFEAQITENVVLKSFLGQEFTVDRSTGIMVGALKNSYVTSPQIIDFGSGENSYKVITSLKVSEGAGRGSNIYALTINEFESGPEKSFAFLRNDEVFFGLCKHY